MAALVKEEPVLLVELAELALSNDPPPETSCPSGVTFATEVGPDASGVSMGTLEWLWLVVERCECTAEDTGVNNVALVDDADDDEAFGVFCSEPSGIFLAPSLNSPTMGAGTSTIADDAMACLEPPLPPPLLKPLAEAGSMSSMSSGGAFFLTLSVLRTWILETLPLAEVTLGDDLDDAVSSSVPLCPSVAGIDCEPKEPKASSEAASLLADDGAWPWLWLLCTLCMMPEIGANVAVLLLLFPCEDNDADRKSVV